MGTLVPTLTHIHKYPYPQPMVGNQYPCLSLLPGRSEHRVPAPSVTTSVPTRLRTGNTGQVCCTRTWGRLIWSRPRFLWPVFDIIITFVDDSALGHHAKEERAKDRVVSFHRFVPHEATGACLYTSKEFHYGPNSVQVLSGYLLLFIPKLYYVS